jgi:hypothetical protein
VLTSVGRIGGCHRKRVLRVRWQGCDSLPERSLDPSAGRQRLLKWLGPCQLVLGQDQCELGQRKGVAAGGLMYAQRHRVGDGVSALFLQNPGGGVGVHAVDPQLGKPGVLKRGAFSVSDREQNGNSLLSQTPGGEKQALEGRRIEPVGIVDQREHRPRLGCRRERGQRRGIGGEAIKWARWRQPKCAGKGIALRVGCRLRQLDHGAEEHRQRGERQLALALESARPQDQHAVGGSLCRPLEEHRLARPRLSTHNKGTARPPRAASSIATMRAPSISLPIIRRPTQSYYRQADLTPRKRPRRREVRIPYPSTRRVITALAGSNPPGRFSS